MLKCEECDLIFNDDEIAEWNENRGEFWGQTCYEKMSGCPYCFSGAIRPYDEEE